MGVTGGAIGRGSVLAARIVLAAATGVVAGVVVWWAATAGPGAAAATGSWRAYPHAFAVNYSWRTGPQALVADPAGCFLGFGADTTGYGLIPGYWRATGDCTRVSSLTPKPRGSGDGPPSSDDATLLDAVAAPDGGYLAIRNARGCGG